MAKLARTTVIGATCALCACGHHTRVTQIDYPDRAIWIEPKGGCNEASPRPLPPQRVSDTLTRAGARYADQLTAWTARRVPGGWADGPTHFAKGPVKIWLRDPSQKLVALAALDSLAHPHLSLTRRDSTIALPARWDHAELYDWLKYIESQFGRYGPLPINFWGVSPHYNRITFGVESSTDLPPAVAWFDKLGIPCWLVAVEVTGPFRLLDKVERPTDR
jgi:hypothetical protein